MNESRPVRHRSAGTWAHVVLIAGIVTVVFPFLWMFATSFKQGADIYSIGLIPKTYAQKFRAPSGQHHVSEVVSEQLDCSDNSHSK